RNVISGGRPGLFLSGSDNVIQGNFIGTDVTGMAQAGNRRAGIYLAYTAQRNLIGGTAPGARNVISGNSTGIFIDSASDNLIQGNYIGLNAAGTDIIFNSTGIMITSFQQDATNNLIGGTAPGAANVISGNGTGVTLFLGAH